MSLAKKIENLLRAGLEITHLSILNQSDQHIGHAGHDGSGESHFKIVIVSDDFIGLSRVERHRRIYHILGDLMKRDIHALAIDARISAEYQPLDDK